MSSGLFLKLEIFSSQMKLPRLSSYRLPRKLIVSPTQTIVSQPISKLGVGQQTKKPMDDRNPTTCHRFAIWATGQLAHYFILRSREDSSARRAPYSIPVFMWYRSVLNEVWQNERNMWVVG